MKTFDAPHFNDDDAARQHLENIRWPDGPFCPRCGVAGDRISKLEGKSTRPGVYKCKDCRKPFTVTVGTVFERSHIPLRVWFRATFLLCSSKKRMSSHQLHRMLGVTYKTAWFMTHRIREAFKDGNTGPIGGQNKVVEVDETYVGGKATNRKGRLPKKAAVITLVERDGAVQAQMVEHVNATNLRPLIVMRASRKSHLMTDESPIYPKTGREFAGHGTVNHSAEEYARGTFWHTNTVGNFFSILKRGIVGVYQHCGEQHLDRYVTEFAFRYNARKMSDAERTDEALRGIEGKRLTYGGSSSARATA